MNEEISLAEPDPTWTQAFIYARAEILSVFPQAPILIAHIGSTAVPGLAAKPVIDIIVLVADMAEVQPALPGLERLGYEFRPAVSNAQRLFLRRHDPNGMRTHHPHLHSDPQDAERHILFRDLLRRDAQLCADYLTLKRDLAALHRLDREAYAKGKDGFIDAAIARVGGPQRAPFWNP